MRSTVISNRARSPSNTLLATLAPEDLLRLKQYLETVFLRRGEVLVEPGEEHAHVYFPYDCAVSFTAVMVDGRSVESAVIGREGLVGFTAALGDREAVGRGVVQIEGSAARLKVERFEAALACSPALLGLCLRYVKALLCQVLQACACASLHVAEQRLCSWLLQLRDRVGRDELRLTHEILAEMLGVQRQTVSLLAGTLQSAGLIRYRHGTVELVDRAGLEEAACECYAAVRAHYERLLPHPFD